MKTITIDFHNYNVTNETAKNIIEMIKNNEVCTQCGLLFSTDNPRITAQLCLSDFSKNNPGLTFEKLEEKTADNEKYTLYTFKDKSGKIHQTDTRNKDIHNANTLSLRFYGFDFPNVHNNKNLYKEWRIIGDYVNDDILVITQYYDIWDSVKLKYVSKKCEFVTIKNQGYIELNRRKKIVQDAIKQSAHKVIEEDGGWYKEKYLNKFLPFNLSLYR